MKLQLVTVKNVKYEIECNGDDTILQLKQMIEKSLNLASVEEQRLIHAGRILKNENTIAFYNIKSTEKIVIMISKKPSINTDDFKQVIPSSIPANPTSSSTTSISSTARLPTTSYIITNVPNARLVGSVANSGYGTEPLSSVSLSLSSSHDYYVGTNTRTLPEAPLDLTGCYRVGYINQNMIYDGEWKDGKHHGKGTLISDVETYEGDWIQGERHGQGTLTRTEGCIYTGEWVHDEIHGHGIMKYPSGNCYDGIWEHGKQNGQATFTYANGDIFHGIYRDNKMMHGKYTSRDGLIYDGEWENDQFHGTGTLSYPNGSYYHGQFRYGKANGLGCMTLFNGNTKDGTWRDDYFIQGIARDAVTGISQTGTFINIGNDDVLHGTVIVRQNDGTQYQTTYQRGMEINHAQQQLQQQQHPPEKIAQITALGFTYLQAIQALSLFGGNVEMAANFLFQEGGNIM